MATRKYNAHINLNQNELQNAVIQNLASAPNNPKLGQEYFNTADNQKYIWNGTGWISETSQGVIYTEGSGIDITGNVISADLSASDIPDLSATYVSTSLLGANSGVATLGSDGKVPSSQLPSFVDDVIDAYIVSGATALSSGWLSDTEGGTALTPETDKIYVIVSSGTYQNKTYRWSGSTYVEISASPGAASESSAGIIEIATQAETNTGTDDTRAITPLKLATYTSGMTKKLTVQNGSLTAVGGQCTWTITNTLGTDDVTVIIKEVSTGAEVYCDITYGSGTITVKINSSSNISADTYKAVIIG